MGSAIYGGLKGAHSLTVVEKSEEQKARLKARFGSVAFVEAQTPVEKDEIVILAIKPQVFEKVSLQGEPEGIISIMAGVTLDRIRAHFRARHFVRVMPNLAALNGRSASVLTGDEPLKERALELVGAIGSALWLESERELDIATALAGSGPGYLALIAEALANGAVRQGLSNERAHALTAALFGGMEGLLEQNHPAQLKEMVCSPGGTTIAGIEVLEKRAVRAAVMEALEAAFKRTQALA